jgi:predicted P-loop ATPase
MPPELRQYYTDSIDFGRKRDAELFLNRFALINIDEFDQITTNQQAFLKHILQAPVVKTRRPHGRSVQELRRYASFIGTSNHKDLLTDTSGSRRFICIEVTDVIDLSRPIHYEQLYSQALAAIYGGERYWFDREEEQLVTTHNQDFQKYHLWKIVSSILPSRPKRTKKASGCLPWHIGTHSPQERFAPQHR